MGLKRLETTGLDHYPIVVWDVWKKVLKTKLNENTTLFIYLFFEQPLQAFIINTYCCWQEAPHALLCIAAELKKPLAEQTLLFQYNVM